MNPGISDYFSVAKEKRCLLHNKRSWCFWFRNGRIAGFSVKQKVCRAMPLLMFLIYFQEPRPVGLSPQLPESPTTCRLITITTQPLTEVLIQPYLYYISCSPMFILYNFFSDAAATAYALNAASVPSPLAGFGAASLMSGPTTRTREPCYLKNHKYTLKKSKKCASPAPDHNFDVSLESIYGDE